MDWYLGGSSIKVCKLHLAVVNCRLINSTMQHHRRMRRHSWTSRSEFDGAILALVVGLGIQRLTPFLLFSGSSQLTDPKNYLASWNTSTSSDPCNGSWVGVLCNAGSVVELDLANAGLTGTLPPAMTELSPSLQLLYLNLNTFVGPLPLSWSQLVNLKVLFLRDNLLSSPLPPAWSSLTNLKTLSVGSNLISSTIPTSWGNALDSLAFLDLSSNWGLCGVIPPGIQSVSYTPGTQLGQICALSPPPLPSGAPRPPFPPGAAPPPRSWIEDNLALFILIIIFAFLLLLLLVLLLLWYCWRKKDQDDVAAKVEEANRSAMIAMAAAAEARAANQQLHTIIVQQQHQMAEAGLEPTPLPEGLVDPGPLPPLPHEAQQGEKTPAPVIGGPTPMAQGDYVANTFVNYYGTMASRNVPMAGIQLAQTQRGPAPPPTRQPGGGSQFNSLFSAPLASNSTGQRYQNLEDGATNDPAAETTRPRRRWGLF